MSQNTILARIFDLCQRLWQGLQGYLTSGKDYKDKSCPCKEKQGTRIRFHPCFEDHYDLYNLCNQYGAGCRGGISGEEGGENGVMDLGGIDERVSLNLRLRLVALARWAATWTEGTAA